MTNKPTERWKAEVYLDLYERRNPGTDEFAKGFNGGIIEARNLIYAKLPALISAILASTPQEPDDALIERVAFAVETAPTHPPGGSREVVSRKLVRKIIEAYRLQAKAPETGWQPIETAPREEFVHTILIARDHSRRCVMPAFFDGEQWQSVSIVGPMAFVNPTHWMPLPQPPETGEE